MGADVCLCSSLSFAFSHVVQAQWLASSYISKGTTAARGAAPGERGGGVNQHGVHRRLWARARVVLRETKKLFTIIPTLQLLLLIIIIAYCRILITILQLPLPIYLHPISSNFNHSEPGPDTSVRP
jgi:hypothetical protein